MLSSSTPFPYVGSFALIEHEGENTLARIVFRREGEVVVGLPLRDGASGNLRVDPARLIDATPLTGEEAREFHDLDRGLAGIEARIRRWAEEEPGASVGEDGRRTKASRKPRLTAKQKAQKARRDALYQRIVYAPMMARLLREAHRRGAIDGQSQGRRAA